MRARGAGTIVNIGSTAGRFTTPGVGAYHISKYGVEALSLALRAEVKQFGVRVVLIEPTGVRNTRFVEAQLTARQSDSDDDPYGEFKRRYAETHAHTGRVDRHDGQTPPPLPAPLSGRSKPKTPDLAMSLGGLERPPCWLGCC